METMTNPTYLNSPTLFSARATCHISGEQAGAIRVDCRLPRHYDRSSIAESLRLRLPGETQLLAPAEVLGTKGEFTIGFLSSDIANAGHLPAECIAVWSTPDEETLLLHMPMETGQQVASREGNAAAAAPGTASASYPRTVIVAIAIALTFSALAVATSIGFAG
jgi:hypothetical protein